MELFSEIWITYLDMAPYLVLGLLFAGVLHIFFRKSFIEKHLGKPGFTSIIKASVLGVPLPLCSCGVVPTALSLKEHKATDGAVVSFLISTPQTGVDSIAATYGMMGPFFAIFRPLAAFIMGVFGGTLTALLGHNKSILKETEVKYHKESSIEEGTQQKILQKIKGIFIYGLGEFLDGISTYIAIGIVISGLITYFLPEDFFSQHIGNQWIEMLLMVIGGVPLYICSTGSIPIALSLLMKGLSPGAAFVFLAVGPATNAATITVIKSKLGTKVTLIYLFSMIFSAMVAGWVMNSFGLGDLILKSLAHEHNHHSAPALLNQFLMGVSLFFLFPLSYSLYKNHLKTPFTKWRKSMARTNATEHFDLPVNGMSCQNCARHVVQASLSVDGVLNAEVDLNRNVVTIEGEKNLQALKEAIEKEGYVVPLQGDDE